MNNIEKVQVGAVEAYDRGHEAGSIEGFEAGRESERDLWDDNGTWDEGYERGLEDAEIPPLAEALTEAIQKAGFDPLNDITVRWDAAFKVFVWTQDGREVIFR